MPSYRLSLMVRITTVLFAMSSLAACGTFEVRIEMPGETPVENPMEGRVTTEIVVTAVRTPALPQERTPTPTPGDYEPWTAQPVLTPMPPGDYAAPAGLSIAFVQDGQVWLWTAETKEAVALATTSRTNGDVVISDDGAIVAFLRGNDLFAIDSDGTGERQLLSIEDLDASEATDPGVTPNRLEWVPGTHTLAFNTRLNMSIGLVLSDDLHLVDAETLERTVLLPPGEGGEFYYSPDGRQIAIVTPGDISLIDADGENRRDQVLTYTPVNTASEVRFYARPAWAADGSALSVAIPPANPHVQPIAQTSIWHIPADGTSAWMLTSIDAAPLLGLDSIAFSPDLEYVAYAQIHLPEGAPPEQAEPQLGVQRLANGDWQGYPYVHTLFGWAPDSRHFAFLAGREEPQLYIGRWSGGTIPGSVAAGTPVFDMRWVDAEHYLCLARSSAVRGPAQGGWDLILADIHGSSTILASMDSYPSYDFTIDPAAHRAEPAQAVTPTPAATRSVPEQTPPTPTPVAALPGLIYQMDDGLWIDRGGQRVRLFDRHVTQLSPDGVHALYVAGDGDDRDLWLAVLPLGEQHNLTRTPERNEDTPRWWAAQPELAVFSSLPQGEPLGIGAIGYLTVVNMDGSDYRVLDDQNYLNSPPAPAPDGKTIAYGGEDGGWLYHWDAGPQPFDPADRGLEGAGEIELGSPAWSPDGTRLAWVLAGDLEGDGGTRWGIGVFDFIARTGQILHLYAMAGGDGWPPAPVWSPDGTWLAFEAWADAANEAGVWVVRADGQGEGTIYLGGRHPVWSPDGHWLALSDPAPDRPGHWMADVGSWTLLALDLPLDAQIVDWISLSGG